MDRKGIAKMKLRTRIATIIGRTTQTFLQKTNSGGTSLPGKLATRIQPNLLKELAKDYEVILITGTNGKTVTTSLATSVLRQQYPHVLTNETGSNLIQGIITAFIQDTKYHKVYANRPRIALLEVDEASVRHVTEHIKPKAILTTNLFLDQVDRFSDVTVAYDYILEGIEKTPETVLIMNGDQPILADEKSTNPHVYFGFANQNDETKLEIEAGAESDNCPKCGTKLAYFSNAYSNLGDYHCPNCAFSRPELTYTVEEVLKMTPTSAQFIIDGDIYETPHAGLYNIYNALAAYSIGRFMNVKTELIARGLRGSKTVFGRQEQIAVEDKDVQINVIKNAVGLNQVIANLALENDPFTFIYVINNNPADGRDVSWISEGDFEKLEGMPIEHMFVSGIAKEQLTEHLLTLLKKPVKLDTLTDTKEIIQTIKTAQTEKVYILASYTAMMEIREELAEQGYVKERMQV